MSSPNQLDILGFNAASINQDIVITLTKENFEGIDKEKKEKCKILKFSSEWKFDEILSTILRLKTQNYPNLFVFIIEEKGFGFFETKGEKLPEKVKILQENLPRFNKNRSMILQVTSRDENVTKFYYKEENSEAFYDIKEQTAEAEDFQDFPTFLWLYLNEKVDDLEDVLLEKLPKVGNFPLILRFLRTLEFSDNFFIDLVLKCAAKGSKSDLLAAIDGYIDTNGKLQGLEANNLISSEFNYTSVLDAAVYNSNQEITKFLVGKCANFIQRLPFEHQVDISTEAYETNQTEVLCDLLEFCDFPFPNDFNSESVTDERLREIVDSHGKLHADVLAENLSGIERFLRNNSNFKFCCNLNNTPAFRYALDSKKFQSFFVIIENLFQTLGEEVMKRFILENEIFASAVCSAMDVKGIEVFIDSVESRTDSNFIIEMLKIKDKKGENVLFKLIRSGNTDTQKFKEISQIMEKFLDFNVIFELMTARNNDGCNILHICTRTENTRQLVILLTVIKSYFNSLNLPHKFKELVDEKSLYYDVNFLHIAAGWKNKESHQTLWRLLLKTFENREELKDSMVEQDEYGNNFFHFLIYSEKPDIIEFTLEKIKKNFNNVQCKEILMSKGENLLLYAAHHSKDIKTHQLLWKIFQDSCESDEEFLEILKQDDHESNTVLHIATRYRTSEVFKFMVQEIEKIPLIERIKEILSLYGCRDRNLLQSAARQNNSLEFHQCLWKIFRKYFNSSEIVDMIKHVDMDGRNLLSNAAESNTKEVVELTWNEITSTFSSYEDIELINFIKSDKNILYVLIKAGDTEKLEFLWKNIENCYKKQDLLLQFKELVTKKNPRCKQNIFLSAALNSDIEFNEALWDLLLDTFEDREDIKNLLMQTDEEDANSPIHKLLNAEKEDMVKFTLKKAKENLSDDQYQQILKSKGFSGRNLLQAAATVSKFVEIHKFLWKTLLDFCKSDAEFLEFLLEVDINGDNVFHLAAAFSTSEIAEFMINEIEKIASRKKVRKLLSKLGLYGPNLLQSAARQNESVELHQSLWKIIRIYFNSSEILDMIKHTDDFGHNLLKTAVEFNTKEVVELTLNEIKNVFNENEDADLTEYLKCTNSDDENILHALFKIEDEEKLTFLWTELENYFKSQNSSQLKELLSQKTLEEEQNCLNIASNCDKIEFHEALWELLVVTFKNRDELKDLLMQGNTDGNNFIHLLVINDEPQIIEFTFKKIKNSFNEDQYQQILRSKGEFARNLLQAAACTSNEIKVHQILWKIFQDSCKSDEEFLEVLHEVDNESNTVLHNAVAYRTSEVFEFMVQELEKVASHEQIKKMLNTYGCGNQNLFQLAAILNESFKLHQSLWKMIQKHFNSSDILNMINHCDEYGDNLLQIVALWNTKEVVQLTWNEIRNIFNENEDTILTEFLKHANNKGENFLHVTTKHEKIEIQETLWELLLKSCENREDLKDLVMQSDQHGNNFIHLLIITDQPHTIEFTLNKTKEIFNDAQHEEILRSKGNYGRNLLQIAACASKNTKTHQILWKLFRDSCKSDEEFSEVLKQTDKNGNNLLHIAVHYNTKEIVQLTWEQVKNFISTKDEQIKYLKTKGHKRQNLLELSAKNQAKDPEVQNWVENLMNEYEIQLEMEANGLFGYINTLIQRFFSYIRRAVWY